MAQLAASVLHFFQDRLPIGLVFAGLPAANLVANYRSRLLAAGLIEAAGHGKVDFAIPGLRQHLRAQTAT